MKQDLAAFFSAFNTFAFPKRLFLHTRLCFVSGASSVSQRDAPRATGGTRVPTARGQFWCISCNMRVWTTHFILFYYFISKSQGFFLTFWCTSSSVMSELISLRALRYLYNVSQLPDLVRALTNSLGELPKGVIC